MAQKLGLGIVVIAHIIVAAALLWIGGDTVFQCRLSANAGIVRLANWLRSARWGIIALYFAMTLAAIPPISGFGTCLTLTGMAFASSTTPDQSTLTASLSRLMYGFGIASLGLVLSSTISFCLLRALFSRYHGDLEIFSLIRRDARFCALQQAVRERGLWMAVLARYVSMANLGIVHCLIASLDSINLFTFILSAIISTPRLFLHVFMGAKLFELMNRDIRLHQDTATKIQNAISLAVGLIVGASSSWLIWRETKRILQLNEPTWDGSYGDQGMDEDQQRFLEDNV